MATCFHLRCPSPVLQCNVNNVVGSEKGLFLAKFVVALQRVRARVCLQFVCSVCWGQKREKEPTPIEGEAPRATQSRARALYAQQLASFERHWFRSRNTDCEKGERRRPRRLTYSLGLPRAVCWDKCIIVCCCTQLMSCVREKQPLDHRAGWGELNWLASL